MNSTVNNPISIFEVAKNAYSPKEYFCYSGVRLDLKCVFGVVAMLVANIALGAGEANEAIPPTIVQIRS